MNQQKTEIGMLFRMVGKVPYVVGQPTEGAWKSSRAGTTRGRSGALRGDGPDSDPDKRSLPASFNVRALSRVPRGERLRVHRFLERARDTRFFSSPTEPQRDGVLSWARNMGITDRHRR